VVAAALLVQTMVEAEAVAVLLLLARLVAEEDAGCTSQPNCSPNIRSLYSILLFFPL
jgi:hypothetical protein